MAVESRRDLASCHGSIVRIAAAHSWSYRSDNPICTRTEAVRWFLLAAEQGHASAQLNLGFMYALGRGVLKDDVLAHMWYNTAGANGDEAARKQRDNLEDDMTRAEISRATELARTCMTSDYQACKP